MNSSVRVFNPSGILDGFSAERLHREVSSALKDGAGVIIIDFQKIEFMKSCCFNFLISIVNEVRLEGGKLFLCSLNEQVKIIFEITKLESIFNIFVSLNECENFIKSMTEFKYELVKK